MHESHLPQQSRQEAVALCPPTSEYHATGGRRCAAGNLDCVSQQDRTLVLLRHAKSAYPDGVPDHDRPLAPRGRREAGLAGDWLRANLPAIDAVLCSTATRARETLAHSAIDAPVRYVDRLYDTVPGTVIDEITHISDDVAVLLVIAHEPTLAQVALGLTGTDSSNTAAAQRISTKFPTSAMAVLQLTCSWKDVELGSAELVDFHVPR
jgi:phosphohistidine phosphatase